MGESEYGNPAKHCVIGGKLTVTAIWLKCCKKKKALSLVESDSEDELDHLEMKLNWFFARE